MPISFGGLATGLDTNSLVSQLMQMERQPIARLEADRAWQGSRLSALSQFDARLKSFLSKIEELDTSDQLRAKKASPASEDYFTVEASSDALPGSYQIEVLALAQTEKEVSQGYASKTDKNFGTGNISLTVDSNDPVSIAIDSENNSLTGIMNAINDADAGVTASIINDGTDSPYRLVVTADDVAVPVILDASALTGGSYADPVFTETQTGAKAHVRVDGIDIYGESNTLGEAIPGVTLDLEKAEQGVTTGLSVELDEEAIKGKIKEFVSGYNAAISFVTSQSKTESSSAGVLSGNSGMNNVKRRLQNLLVTGIENSGNFTAFSQLGLETQKDGTLKIDDETLSDAVRNDLDSVEKLIAGEGEVDGIAVRFRNYLEDITDSTDGFLVGSKVGIEGSIKRIDKDIERIEMRLEKREENLLEKFRALEQLVSVMNSQSEFLTRQMDQMSNLWSRK